jgi:hypothetical protein
VKTQHLEEVLDIVRAKPLLTRSDLAVRWRISLRRVDQIRTEDPNFPNPRRVLGPRWTPEEINRYETRNLRTGTP